MIGYSQPVFLFVYKHHQDETTDYLQVLLVGGLLAGWLAGFTSHHQPYQTRYGENISSKLIIQTLTQVVCLAFLKRLLL